MQHRVLRYTALVVLAVAAIASGASVRTARAAEETAYVLTIKDHRFDPTELNVPANTKVAITVRNLDPTPEEFESIELRREKVVAGGQEISVYVGPLRPGRYEFFGDFNPKTARGHIVVK